MIVEHAFTVDAPSERVHAALLDLRSSVPCLPGIHLEDVQGDTATGRFRPPPGSVTLSYRGTLRLVESDPDACSLRASLQGTTPQGGGTASADIEVRLRESNGLTTASVRGELTLDGRPPALAPDALERAAADLLRRFGRCLEEGMAQGADPGGGVDPVERLEETIAALTQLERVTAGRPPAGRRPDPPPAVAAGVQTAAPQRPVAAGSAVREPRISGRIEVVTTTPVPVPRNPSRRERAGDRVDERPWVIPAALISVLMLWLLARRRE